MQRGGDDIDFFGTLCANHRYPLYQYQCRPSLKGYRIAWSRRSRKQVCTSTLYHKIFRLHRNLSDGMIVVAVPLNLIISGYVCLSTPELRRLDSVMSDAPHPLLANYFGNITSDDIFVLFLLLEKSKPNSFWKHYIINVPETYSIPTYWNDNAQKCLTNYAQMQITKKKKKFADAFQKVSDILQHGLQIKGKINKSINHVKAFT